jgi:hypothetical protein
MKTSPELLALIHKEYARGRGLSNATIYDIIVFLETLPSEVAKYRDVIRKEIEDEYRHEMGVSSSIHTVPSSVLSELDKPDPIDPQSEALRLRPDQECK